MDPVCPVERRASLRARNVGAEVFRHTARMKRTILTACLVALAASGLASWATRTGPRSSSAESAYPVEGVVLALEGPGAILVAHREVAGFMPAMTMPFALADVRDRDRLSPGDVVRFTLRVGAGRSEASAVEVVGRDDAAVAAYRAATTRPAARLRTGDRLPAFSLIDQDGAPLSDGDLAGGPAVVTFIFTRCPVPEYCPRIAGRFREVQRALVSDTSLAGVRLFSVTLDPAHDTPAVLADYGRAMGADFARWRFLTGSPDQVTALTRAFAVYTQPSAGTIDHTLATAVIDAHGRVVEIWRGNEWTVAEVLDALRRVTRPA